MDQRDEQKVKITSGMISWTAPWFAGWLFTLGYLATAEGITMAQAADESLWGLIKFLLATVAFWPLFLGMEFAGGFEAFQQWMQ